MRQPGPNLEQLHRKTRLLSVLAATAIALSCGTNYAYSAWSPQFAEALHLSATSTNLIGNFGNIGMYAMGIPGGILIDKMGPRYGVMAGCVALACGYFPLRAAYVNGPAGGVDGAGDWFHPGVPALCFFALLTGMGSCTAFSAAIKVSATNWPQHRGTATAFPLSAFGLSAFFYTMVAGLAFPDDTAGYLLLLACGTTLMVFVGMFFLQIVHAQGGKGGGYEVVPGGEESRRLRRASSHSRHSSKGSMGENGTPEETSTLVSTPSTSRDNLDDPSPKHITNTPHKPDITGLRLLTTPKFWHLFILLALLCGVGLMTINNIGNNARALWRHYDDTASHDFIQQRQLMHVSILSVMSFCGRLLSGIGSDWLTHHGLSRYIALVGSGGLFVAAQVVALGIEDPNELFWLSGLTGLAYGALFGVYPALVADAFGPTGMGINWGAMTMAPVISGNVFNLAYGRILDGNSYFEGDGKGGGEEVCREGRECYRGAYWITLVASAVGVGWALWCIRHERVEKRREAREELGGREHEG